MDGQALGLDARCRHLPAHRGRLCDPRDARRIPPDGPAPERRASRPAMACRVSAARRRGLPRTGPRRAASTAQTRPPVTRSARRPAPSPFAAPNSRVGANPDAHAAQAEVTGARCSSSPYRQRRRRRPCRRALALVAKGRSGASAPSVLPAPALDGVPRRFERLAGLPFTPVPAATGYRAQVARPGLCRRGDGWRSPRPKPVSPACPALHGCACGRSTMLGLEGLDANPAFEVRARPPPVADMAATAAGSPGRAEGDCKAARPAPDR